MLLLLLKCSLITSPLEGKETVFNFCFELLTVCDVFVKIEKKITQVTAGRGDGAL